MTAARSYRPCASSGCFAFIDTGTELLVRTDHHGDGWITATHAEFLAMYDAIRSDGPNGLHDLAQRIRDRRQAAR